MRVSRLLNKPFLLSELARLKFLTSSSKFRLDMGLSIRVSWTYIRHSLQVDLTSVWNFACKMMTSTIISLTYSPQWVSIDPYVNTYCCYTHTYAYVHIVYMQTRTYMYQSKTCPWMQKKVLFFRILGFSLLFAIKLSIFFYRTCYIVKSKSTTQKI